MNYTEIINQVKQCIPLIKNWEAIENLNLDFSRVDIEGFMVDKHEDKNGRSWEYSLLTTMYSQANSDERDVYLVHWHFKDLWGNRAFFTLEGPLYTGSLHLEPVFYDDNEGRVVFSILSNHVENVMKEDESGHCEFVTEYDTPLFYFNEPDEVTIISAEWKGRRIVDENKYEGVLEW